MDAITAAATFPSDVASVSLARRFVRDALGSTASAGVVDDLQLIVSELVTNAVQYGGDEAVGVDVGQDDDQAWVAVRNRSGLAHLAPTDRWQVAANEQLDGRGLGIVRAIADDVGVERAEGHLVVRAARRLHR